MQYPVYDHVLPVHQEFFLKLWHFADILSVLYVFLPFLLYVRKGDLVHFDRALLLDLLQVFHRSKRLPTDREVRSNFSYRDADDLPVRNANFCLSLEFAVQELLQQLNGHNQIVVRLQNVVADK